MAMNLIQDLAGPEQDNLWAGPQVQEIITRPIVLGANLGNLKRGTVLGLVTKEPDTPASGDDPAVIGDPIPYDQQYCVVVDNTATDGSAEVYCVLTDDKPDSTTTQPAVGYFSGCFNRYRLTFKSGQTWKDFDLSGRKLDIHFRDVVRRVEV